MISPTCEICGKELPDWQANIMVNNQSFTDDQIIDRLKVVCKPCSIAMIGTSQYSRNHNLWELTWVRDNFVFLLGVLLIDMSSNPANKWTDEALNDFYKLANLRFPDLGRNAFSIPD